MKARPNHHPSRRVLLASWRDTRVLLREFRVPLLFFVGSSLLGGLLFDLLYTHAQVQELSYAESVYAVFSMIFFEQNIPLPRQWFLQAFFFVMPIVGLGLIAQRVANLDDAL